MKTILFETPWKGLAALLLLVGSPALAEPELAVKGDALVRKYCYQCHGITFNGDSALDVTNRTALLDPDHEYVLAGNAEGSQLWQRIASNEMPPKSQPQPTPEERELLKQWIHAGAPFPERVVRHFVEWKSILQAIHDDLKATSPEVRQYVRYFTLTNLYNDVHGVTELEMRLYRAALSKALNSVSWQPDLVIPKPLDPEQTLFRVDIRDLGWTDATWRMLASHYPYGMGFNTVPDDALAKLDEDIGLYTDTPLCYLRADWFIVRAMRPPLYNKLLKLPKTDVELEKLLKVSVVGDFEQDRLRRAGFVESAVSAGNRIVDRHPASYGYYWKSYDFKKSTLHGNIMRFPLGPAYDKHPFDQLCFEQDGGEMIFGLPNGLQGYYLVDGKGHSIDEGPIEVVRDLTETSGAPIIMNGISCMSCHRHGMISFTDTLRDGAGCQGEARRKLRSICPPKDEMSALVAKDRNRFLQALAACTGPFLQVGDDAGKSIEEFPEPIGSIARRYEQRLGIEQVACECLVQEPMLLKGAVQSNPQLRNELGLGPLVNNEKINRANWETRDGVISPAQRLMQALDLGTPKLVFVSEE